MNTGTLLTAVIRRSIDTLFTEVYTHLQSAAGAARQSVSDSVCNGDTLVDANLANNTLGWQWAAGCGADAAPYYRIFNPMTQSRKFDPDGSYIRRFLPELAQFPTGTCPLPGACPTQRSSALESGWVVITLPRSWITKRAARRLWKHGGRSMPAVREAHDVMLSRV